MQTVQAPQTYSHSVFYCPPQIHNSLKHVYEDIDFGEIDCSAYPIVPNEYIITNGKYIEVYYFEGDLVNGSLIFIGKFTRRDVAQVAYEHAVQHSCLRSANLMRAFLRSLSSKIHM
jgi:hypothetical protein